LNGKKFLLTLWLAAPIVLVAILCAWIVLSLRAGPKMHAEPVGAGAGDAGGANALGEWLERRAETGVVTLIIEDRTGLTTSENPLSIACRSTDWKPIPLTPLGPSRWSWQGSAAELDKGFELWYIPPGGDAWHDAQGRRTLRVSSGEQTVVLEKLVR